MKNYHENYRALRDAQEDLLSIAQKVILRNYKGYSKKEKENRFSDYLRICNNRIIECYYSGEIDAAESTKLFQKLHRWLWNFRKDKIIY